MTYSKLWVIDTGERAVKTAAQTAIALLSVSGVDLLELDWKGFTSAVVLATLLSILSSVASAGSSGNSASLVVNNVEKKQ